MKKSDLYWLAGLLEGEGSFIKLDSPGVRISMTDQDGVVRASKLMGNSKIYRRCANPLWQATWTTYVYGDRAIEIMKLIFPIMGERRSARIREILDWARARPRGRRVLNDDDVATIRLRYSDGQVSQRKLAKEYHVGQNTISKVVNHKGRCYA